MTYRSASRGIMYTAPPSGDENGPDDRSDETTTDAPEESEVERSETKAERIEATDETPAATEAEDADRETPTLESTTATTDANWTGTVPADD